jgi:EAL domain-containing protein (putative c-di-GMP-specific phosphodiesterase class I)
LEQSLGLWPGTAVTGFPPGEVTPPAAMDVDNGAALQAQSDLTVAYENAESRESTETSADLGNKILQGGVYAAPLKGR